MITMNAISPQKVSFGETMQVPIGTAVEIINGVNTQNNINTILKITKQGLEDVFMPSIAQEKAREILLRDENYPQLAHLEGVPSMLDIEI